MNTFGKAVSQRKGTMRALCTVQPRYGFEPADVNSAHTWWCGQTCWLDEVAEVWADLDAADEGCCEGAPLSPAGCWWMLPSCCSRGDSMGASICPRGVASTSCGSPVM